MNGGMTVFVSGGMRSALSRDTLPDYHGGATHPKSWPDAIAHERSGCRVRRPDLAGQFRPTRFSAFQAWRIRLWLMLVARGLFRFRIEADGLEHIPPGESLIVAVAPHRNWIDPFLILQVFPALPRLYFLAASDTAGARW
jgi:hypothetical protein